MKCRYSPQKELHGFLLEGKPVVRCYYTYRFPMKRANKITPFSIFT